MNVTVLVGRRRRSPLPARACARCPTAEVTAVVNTGDDTDAARPADLPRPRHRACTPSAAASTRSAAGAGPARRWTVKDELAAYGADPDWFGLGDRDIATHLVRTRMLRRRLPALRGHRGAVRPLAARASRCCPMSDQRVETHVVVDDPDGPDGAAGHPLPGVVGPAPGALPAHRVRLGRRRAGRAGARRRSRRSPAPTSCCSPPSNPVVSIGTDPRRARRAGGAARRRRPVVGVSPDRRRRARCAAWPTRCLAAIGVEASAEGVGRHYGARADGGLLDAWLVHTGDAADVPGVDGRAPCRC